MKFDINNTFCNPIVLPEYPVQNALHFGPPDPSADPWERGGNEPVKDHDMVVEYGGEDGFPMLMDTMTPGFGIVTLNDTRSTADPNVCFFDGRWYLYASTAQVYSSEDLVHWEIHKDDSWMKLSDPMAPTVEQWNGKYYAIANGTPLHVSESPVGPWEKVGDLVRPDGKIFTVSDPALFHDDDNRMYLYFGLGTYILGAELDPQAPNRLLTEPKILIRFHKENKWERWGGRNENWGLGYIEGSWMLKHDGTYYLVYSCAGTEFYNYAMGCYICDSPLGDFRLQPRNPISCNRDGLVRGGGHGSIVKGPKDTYWIFYTMALSVDFAMERRIGMDPAGFDEDGNLFALTGCDVPQFKPGVLDHPEKGNAAQLVPVSVMKVTRTSSNAPGHRPIYALDESLLTWWQPDEADPEPTFALALQGSYYISALRIMWKDVGMDLEAGVLPGPYRYIVEYTKDFSSEEWITLVDASQNETDLAVDYRTFDTVRAKAVRIRILDAPEGITPGLLNFTVFGESVFKDL